MESAVPCTTEDTSLLLLIHVFSADVACHVPTTFDTRFFAEKKMKRKMVALKDNHFYLITNKSASKRGQNKFT